MIFKLLAIISVVNLWSCRVTEPPETDNSVIKLTALEASVNEAWLRVEVENSIPGRSLVLQRNGQDLLSFSSQKDTILTDTTVDAANSYNYIVVSRTNNSITSRSNEVSLSTLHPTSHERVWEYYTFGESSSCSFRDVAIINENDIWAVGVFFLRDSTGQLIYRPYNAVHWNGREWEMKTIDFTYYYGGGPSDITSVYAFASDNVLVSDGSCVMRWDGSKWGQFGTLFFPDRQIGEVYGMWGTSERNLYGAGPLGSIVHFDGHTWRKIESNTNANINDVWGTVDPLTGNETVYCAVTNILAPGDRKILKITGMTKVDSISWNQGRQIKSVWTTSGFPLYTAGEGLFDNRHGHWTEDQRVPSKFSQKIRGTGINNMFVCGDYGLLGHYNGKEWYFYNKNYILNSDFLSIAVKDNIVVAVGYSGSKAVILKSTR